MPYYGPISGQPTSVPIWSPGRCPLGVIGRAASWLSEDRISVASLDLANIKLRLVHSQPIYYNDTESEYFDHLYRMLDAFSKVRALRNEKRLVPIVDDASGCRLATRVAGGDRSTSVSAFLMRRSIAPESQGAYLNHVAHG